MKLIIAFLALALVVAGTAFVLQGGLSANKPRATITQAAPTDQTDAQITAQAKVVPAHQVGLRYPTNNILPESSVAEVLVHEGDTVAKGTPLARLDTRDLELRV